MAISLEQVHKLLIAEARLLDGWRLEEWVALFTGDAEYLVPALDVPNGLPGESLFLIYDDRVRLEQRAARLAKRTAHAEYPHSTTTRLISNIEIDSASETEARAVCSFVVYRSRGDVIDIYPGRSYYDLAVVADKLMIRRKKAVLGLEQLRPQGKLSIIL